MGRAALPLLPLPLSTPSPGRRRQRCSAARGGHPCGPCSCSAPAAEGCEGAAAPLGGQEGRPRGRPGEEEEERKRKEREGSGEVVPEP